MYHFVMKRKTFTLGPSECRVRRATKNGLIVHPITSDLHNMFGLRPTMSLLFVAECEANRKTIWCLL